MKDYAFHKQRLHGLDFLRGLMMTFGVVLHGAQMYMELDLAFDYYRDPIQSITMDGVLIYINTFRMPVFYILSGFFTALLFARYGLRDMLMNRTKRLLVPFLVFLPTIGVSLNVLWVLSSNLDATGRYGFDLSHVKYPFLLYNNTHQMWFVYYLMIFVVAAALLLSVKTSIPLALRQSISTFLQRCAPMNFAVVLVVGFTIALISSGQDDGRVNGSMMFNVRPTILIYFGLYFLLGWLLYHAQHMIVVFERRGWFYFSIANLCFITALAGFLFRGEQEGANYMYWQFALVFFNGISVAFFVAAFIGLFSRYFCSFNPWIRYFSDSAYWVFIIHQTVLVILAMPMHEWQIVAELKFLIACSGTMLISMLTYHYWVRPTWIGAMLNGHRYPRKLPTANSRPTNV